MIPTKMMELRLDIELHNGMCLDRQLCLESILGRWHTFSAVYQQTVDLRSQTHICQMLGQHINQALKDKS